MNIYSKAKVACLVGISFPMIMWVFMLGHIPIIYKKLELSETSWGIFLLIFGLIQILTGQVCSRLITPRFGTKIMMFMGILLLSISFLIIIYITNYISFLIIACLFGISLVTLASLTGYLMHGKRIAYQLILLFSILSILIIFTYDPINMSLISSKLLLAQLSCNVITVTGILFFQSLLNMRTLKT